MQQLNKALGFRGRDPGQLHAERIALLWLLLSGHLDTLRSSPLSLRVESFFCFNTEQFHKTHVTPCISCCRWVRAFVAHSGVAVRFVDSGGAVLAQFDRDGTGLPDQKRRQTAENLKRLVSHPVCRPSIQAQAGDGARLELAQAEKKKDEADEDCSTTRNIVSSHVSETVPTQDGWSKVKNRRQKSHHDDQAGGETPQPPAANTWPSKKKDTTTTAEQKAAEDKWALVALQPEESTCTTVPKAGPKASNRAVKGSPPLIIDGRRDQNNNRATNDAQPEVLDAAATNKRPTKKRKATNRSTKMEKASVQGASTGDKRRRAQVEYRVSALVAFLPSSYRTRLVGVLAALVVAILALPAKDPIGAFIGSEATLSALSPQIATGASSPSSIGRRDP
jgi:hypothetical protein